MSVLWVFLYFYTTCYSFLEAEGNRQEDYSVSDVLKLKENIHTSSFKRKKRIISEVKNPTEAVFLASVQRISNTEHLCVATLITLKTLITSCSCVIHVPGKYDEIPMFSPELYMVVAGLKNFNYMKAINIRYVLQFHHHPRCFYSKEIEAWSYNLGYIKVKSPFMKSAFLGVAPFSKSQILYENQFLKYFNNLNFTDGGKSNCMIYSWESWHYFPSGRDLRRLSTNMNTKKFQFVNYERCAKTFCSKNTSDCIGFKNDQMFCASFKSNKSSIDGLCPKDQGAPLICDGSILAIGTPTLNCGSTSKLSFFQKLIITQLYRFDGTDVVKGKASRSSYELFVFLLAVLIVVKFQNTSDCIDLNL